MTGEGWQVLEPLIPTSVCEPTREILLQKGSPEKSGRVRIKEKCEDDFFLARWQH